MTAKEEKALFCEACRSKIGDLVSCRTTFVLVLTKSLEEYSISKLSNANLKYTTME
jgi:hypothetical protein